MTNNILKNYNILITGGCGFVGSSLAKYLSKNNSVSVLDNQFSGKKIIKKKNINYFFGSSLEISKIFKNKKNFDFIFHLGEYSRVEQSYDDIDKVIEFNTVPFYEVLKFAKKNNCKLIYSGSSTRFASYDKNSEMSPYAWSKISNINLLKQYSKWFHLSFAVTYFYNVYGDGEINNGKYATVVAKFLKYKKSNKEFLPIVSPGTQKRNFTHINDIVSGLEIVALKGTGDGYGIGSDKAYSVIDLAKLLKMNYKIIDPRKGNRLNGTLKTDKTKRLGWKCRYDLKSYIISKIG